MRKRKSPRPYLQVFAVLLLLMTIPEGVPESIQGTTVAILAPTWQQLNHIKKALQHVSNIKVMDADGRAILAQEEIQRLKLENQLLTNEIQKLKELLQRELFTRDQIGEFITKETLDSLQPLVQLHQKDLSQIIALELQSIPAQVIFRSPASWNSSLWINVGKKSNGELGREVIAKNSPVVIGTSVVGVIDYVGNHQSRVRLITDSGLTPSVRAIRVEDGETRYLAKGELRGSTRPLWRGRSPLLKGEGFNYDFPDEEGPARDLRSGEPIGTTSVDVPKMDIVQTDDLLVTTGMDGVFPPGLQVAKVTHIDILKEGDYYYELEARPSVNNLDDLSLVYVIPPLGYHPEDRPPPVGR
ncbi:MAG: rod shape-determining protein MreC [Waddliaceae bacterium]